MLPQTIRLRSEQQNRKEPSMNPMNLENQEITEAWIGSI